MNLIKQTILNPMRDHNIQHQCLVCLTFMLHVTPSKQVMTCRSIQALSLTFIFHEGLSFMALGHNLKCTSILILADGGSRIAPLVGLKLGLFCYFSDLRSSDSLSMQPLPFLALFFHFVRTFYSVDDSLR